MDSSALLRYAEIAGGVLVVAAAARYTIRFIAGSEERKHQRMLHQALEAGDLRRAGDIQLGRGLYREAARIYQRAGDHVREARALIKLGDDKGAAQASEKAKDFAQAAQLYRNAGEPLRAAECFEKAEGPEAQRGAAECFGLARQHLRAARLFEKLGDFDRAADHFSKLDKLDPPDHLVVMLENAAVLAADPLRKRELWKRCADEALKLGDHARAAQDFERAGLLDRAALLYEESLKQPAVAAAIYEELGQRDAAARLSKIAGAEAVNHERAARARARGDTDLANQLAAQSKERGTVAVSRGAARATQAGGAKAPGDQRFELLGELGRGGMGVVYRARDLRLDRFVALKFMPEDLETDPALLKVFRREARAAAALSHPGIVTVYDVGTLDGREYIAMELVEGTTLDRVLAELGPLPVRRALDIFDKVLEAVAAAHEQGIVHRDLKPGNIMTTKNGIKVMDFGLAKVSAAQRSSGHQTILGGTPAYMPPEQMTGAADHRADIFALGATFYELLTGKLPGKDGMPANMARDYPSPHQVLPSVPDRLSQTIMRCLAHEVSERVPSVATLQQELREVRAALDAIENELRAFLSEKGN